MNAYGRTLVATNAALLASVRSYWAGRGAGTGDGGSKCEVARSPGKMAAKVSGSPDAFMLLMLAGLALLDGVELEVSLFAEEAKEPGKPGNSAVLEAMGDMLSEG